MMGLLSWNSGNPFYLISVYRNNYVSTRVKLYPRLITLHESMKLLWNVNTALLTGAANNLYVMVMFSTIANIRFRKLLLRSVLTGILNKMYHMYWLIFIFVLFWHSLVTQWMSCRKETYGVFVALYECYILLANLAQYIWNRLIG